MSESQFPNDIPKISDQVEPGGSSHLPDGASGRETPRRTLQEPSTSSAGSVNEPGDTKTSEQQPLETPIQKAVRLAKEGKVDEALTAVTPQEKNMDEVIRQVQDLIAVDDKDVSGQQIHDVAEALRLAGHDAEGAEIILNATPLSDEKKNAIKEQLHSRTPEEKREDQEIAEDEAAKMKETTVGVREAIEKGLEGIKQQVAEEADPKKKSFLEAQLASFRKRMHHIEDWFKPDEPLKTWAGRLGKTLYVALLTFLLFIIWEMNLISKAAGGKK